MSRTHGQIIRSLWDLFLPVAVGRWRECGALWCESPILVGYRRCWEGLQLQEGRSDTGTAAGAWQRLEASSWHRHKPNITSARTLEPLLCCFPLVPLRTADKRTDTNPVSIGNNFKTEKTSFLHKGYFYQYARDTRLWSKQTPEFVVSLLLFGPNAN